MRGGEHDVCPLCVLGVPVEVPQCSEAASLGAMLLAGVGARIFPDISQAVKEVVKIKRSFYPEPPNVAVYQRIYQDYLSLYEKLYSKT